MVKKLIKKIILLNKKEGETPLEALEVFRHNNKEYKDAKKIRMTYAGRLDPMASGALLILAGEETKNKEKYLVLDKEYEFSVLFGFATDTYDILGKVTDISHGLYVQENDIKGALKNFVGKYKQKYPMYSSKTVKGKPLFQYARDGEDVGIPEREVHVKYLKFIKLHNITSKKLLADMEKRIRKVKGDFRQKEIIKLWKKYLHTSKLKSDKYVVASFKIKCGSGTYVRGIANSLGERLGMPALAYSIKRTKLGKMTLAE